MLSFTPCDADTRPHSYLSLPFTPLYIPGIQYRNIRAQLDASRDYVIIFSFSSLFSQIVRRKLIHTRYLPKPVFLEFSRTSSKAKTA